MTVPKSNGKLWNELSCSSCSGHWCIFWIFSNRCLCCWISVLGPQWCFFPNALWIQWDCQSSQKLRLHPSMFFRRLISLKNALPHHLAVLKMLSLSPPSIAKNYPLIHKRLGFGVQKTLCLTTYTRVNNRLCEKEIKRNIGVGCLHALMLLLHCILENSYI